MTAQNNLSGPDRELLARLSRFAAELPSLGWPGGNSPYAPSGAADYVVFHRMHAIALEGDAVSSTDKSLVKFC